MLHHVPAQVDSVEVGGVGVHPAGGVRHLVAIDVDGKAAGQVVGAVVAAAFLAQWLCNEPTTHRVAVWSAGWLPLRITRH